MEEAWFILIGREDDPSFKAGATWFRVIGNPWRCIDVSSEFSWMLTTEAKDAVARLTREGFKWNKYECEVRKIS